MAIDRTRPQSDQRYSPPGAGTDRYPAVDELARAARGLVGRHPRWCTLRTVGRSRGGEPLLLLSAGTGEADVLVVAGPHANEPVGGATVLRLAERICAEPGLRALARWHLLLCLDPDGARLGQAWARRPGLLRDQVRHFYRPAADGQPEWLPADGRPPQPETAAVLALLDELRPVAQLSLHGNDLGVTWVQLTHDVPDAAELLARPAAGLGIPLAAPGHDTHEMRHTAPGVFVMRGAGPTLGVDLSGRSTWAHAVRHGTVTAVVEAPVWAVPGADDTGPVADPQAAVDQVLRLLRARTEVLADLTERARPVCRGGMFSAAEWFTASLPPTAADWQRLAAPGLGTRCGELMLRMNGQRLPLRAAVLLTRALRESPDPRAAAVREAVDGLTAAWTARYEREFRPRWIPVREQAALQEEFAIGLTARLVS